LSESTPIAFDAAATTELAFWAAAPVARPSTSEAAASILMSMEASGNVRDGSGT
jgi:hypothetical protein